MEIALLIVSTTAVVVAITASAMAWRLYHREHQRAVARVAALTSAALGPLDGTSENESVEAGVHGGERLPITPGGARTAAGRPALVAATAALCLGLAGTLAWTVAQTRADRSRTAPQAAPLELVSLAQTRKDSTITVSGLVRNPVAGRPLMRLAAVVFLFDRDGTLVGSGRAPVDFTTLGSGDESPFVVALEAPAAVARYRVSFRTETGTVPHVDRRGAVALATATGPPALPRGR